MPEPLEIVWTTKGLKNVLTELKTVSKAMENAQSAANSAASKGRSSTGGGSGGSGGSGGGNSGGGSRSSRPPTVPGLPAYARATLSKQDRLNQLLQQAQQGNNPTAVAALQAKISRSGGTGFAGKIQSLIASTRIGGGGGMGGAMPLVGRLTALLGEGAEAGPIGMIAAAATAAAASIYILASKAAEAANSFSKLEFASGSQGGGAAHLRSLGNSIGMDGGAMGALAESFHNKITETGEGRAFATRVGITAGGHGPYGEQDYGKELLQGIEGLRSINNFTERVRVARSTGLEGALPLTKISDKQWAKVQGDAAVGKKLFDPAFQEQSADFTSSLGRMSEAGENLLIALGKPLLKDMTDFFNGVADAGNNLALFLNAHPGLVQGMGDMFQGVQGIFNTINRFVGGSGSAADEHTAALDRNTKANDDNTSALSGAPGTYGHGPRLGSAIPSGLGGDNLRHSLEGSANRLGVY